MEQKHPTKPVFLKYRWPPAGKEEKPTTNVNDATKYKPKRRERDEMVTNDIYGIEDTNILHGENLYDEVATATHDVHDEGHSALSNPENAGNSSENAEDPRKSFVIPDDVETYEEKVGKILNKYGASCKLGYLYAANTERLTGPEAVKIAFTNYMNRKVANYYDIDFLVDRSGVTITDEKKRKFFRKHFPRHTISYCSTINEYQGVEICAKGILAIVARKITGKSNECHLFRQVQPCEPARAVVNFINTGYDLPKIE